MCNQLFKLNKFNIITVKSCYQYFINSSNINKYIDKGLFNYFGVIAFNKYILYLANY